MKDWKQIEKEVQEIVSERAKKIAELKAQRDDTRAKIEEVTSNKMAAEQATDLKAYAAATAKLRELQDGLQMFSSKITSESSQPLISEAEYLDYKKHLFKYLDTLNKDSHDRLLKVIEPMQKERDHLLDEYNHVNALLHQLQRELLKQGDRKNIYDENGNRTQSMVIPDDKYTRMDLIWFYNNVLSQRVIIEVKDGKK